MDNFLNKLYDEGRAKQASADMNAFLKTLSVEELAELAGVKVAVAGPTEPHEPVGGCCDKCKGHCLGDCTCHVAAAAKVTQQAVLKKTTPPEEPKVNAETPGVTSSNVPQVDGEKRAQAEFISMAMHAVADAPEMIRKTAAKLVAKKLSQITE